jgi:excinuclease ABC subunit C
MQTIDKPKDIPTNPGVYRFRDDEDRVIYVGKAKNLKNRLNSYFSGELIPRTKNMVETARTVDWVIVRTETEALQLEFSWIKQFDPSFNVRFRDDKTYPYLAVSVKEEYPRAFIYRGDRKKGIKYFGPFVQSWSIRDTLDHLLRVFPVRSCTTGVFKSAKSSGRPCLLAHIERCSAPCVGRIDEAAHRNLVEQFVSFMNGNHQGIIKDVSTRMKNASEQQDYERASVLRDDLLALERVREKSAVVFTDSTDADLVAVVHDELQAAVQIFNVRAGRIVGQRGFIMENSVESTTATLLTDALMHIYSKLDKAEIPLEILTNEIPDSESSLQQLLSEVRQANMVIRVPVRGDKRALMQTVLTNAHSALMAHKSKRSTDLIARTQALNEIQEALGLARAPLRIECIDVSHIQGTNVVASLVVFEDGLPAKKDYRRYVIENTRDDTSSIIEVVSRRFKAQQETSGPYRPNLLVIDGGLPQVNAAAKALSESGIASMHVVGLAKRMEEIWRPGDKFPLVLSRNSEALFLLQRIRDEAHRFAITHHRERRSKSMVDSALDAIVGLGPVKKKALLAKFGSLKKIKSANSAELMEVAGIGPKQAAEILSKLVEIDSDDSGFNATTGEIIK